MRSLRLFPYRTIRSTLYLFIGSSVPTASPVKSPVLRARRLPWLGRICVCYSLAMETITLSLTEHLNLANQFQILAALNPSQADNYNELITIAKRGFSAEYGNLFSEFNREGMTIEECEYVGEVMDMYWSIQDSYDRLSDKEGLKESDVVFPGFDGNNELSFIAYAKFRFNEGAFNGLRYSSSLDFHFPTTSTYRLALQRYESMPSGYINASYQPPKFAAYSEFLNTIKAVRLRVEGVS